jgi:hypothetical protein
MKSAAPIAMEPQPIRRAAELKALVQMITPTRAMAAWPPSGIFGELIPSA